jgi:hypothetical protein
LIIFPRCGSQRKKVIGIVGNNADKHTELKVELFSALLPKSWKNDLR